MIASIAGSSVLLHTRNVNVPGCASLGSTNVRPNARQAADSAHFKARMKRILLGLDGAVTWICVREIKAPARNDSKISTFSVFDVGRLRPGSAPGQHLTRNAGG